MTSVFYARPHGRVIEIKSKFGRKKLHRTNRIKAPIFLEPVLARGTMWEPQSNLEEKDNPSFLKYDFSSRANHPFSHQ